MNLANIREDIIIEDEIHIDMSLESGYVGIEDTLRDYFKEQFNYIENLGKYLKQWVETIKIKDVNCRTTQLNGFMIYSLLLTILLF